MNVSCPYCNAEREISGGTKTVTCHECGKLYSADEALDMAEIPPASDQDTDDSDVRTSGDPAVATPGSAGPIPWKTVALTIAASSVIALVIWLALSAIRSSGEALDVDGPLGEAERRPLGSLDSVLEWFSKHGMRPSIAFDPEKAETDVLRGREFYAMQLWCDASRPSICTAFFDKEHIVRAVSFRFTTTDMATTEDKHLKDVRARESEVALLMVKDYAGFVLKGDWSAAQFPPKKNEYGVTTRTLARIAQGRMVETLRFIKNEGGPDEEILGMTLIVREPY